MTVKFTLDFEENDLTDFDYTYTSNGSIAASAASAMAGTNYGCACTVNGVANAYAYGRKNFTITSDDIRWRVYLDPNSITMADGDNYYGFAGDVKSSGTPSTLIATRTYYTAAEGYRLRLMVWEDNNNIVYGTTFNISDTAQYIEVHLERASSAVADDGRARIWVDGTLKDTVSNVDNYDCFHNANYLGIGLRSGVDVGTSGTIYIDECVLNDDGSEIGPLAPAGLAGERGIARGVMRGVGRGI